ncbi:hypothetical protein ACM66B_002847 [Microbotryomycetes sp. NB124-2]
MALLHDDYVMVNPVPSEDLTATTGTSPTQRSVFQSPSSTVHDVPFNIINRPLESVLDESKVQQFMKDIQAGDEFTPMEIYRVNRDGKTYYMAFGGCHRYEAHRRLHSETVRGRIIDASPQMIRHILGGSSPF